MLNRRTDMTRLTVLFAFCVIALVGCGKKDGGAAATEGQPTPEQAAKIESEYILPTKQTDPAAAVAANPPQDGAPAKPPRAQPVVPIQQRLQGAIHAQLTIQLRRYMEKNGRAPDNFSDFVNATMDSVPEAPEGMKFAIDATDGTVKVVKK